MSFKEKIPTIHRMVTAVSIVIAVAYGQSMYNRVEVLEYKVKKLAEANLNVICYLAEKDGKYIDECY